MYATRVLSGGMHGENLMPLPYYAVSHNCETYTYILAATLHIISDFCKETPCT